MRELIRWPASLGFGVALAVALAVSVSQMDSQNPATQPEANPDALVLVDFQKRIDQYMEMHKDVEKGSAEQQETSDPAQIRQAQVNLAERLRAARRDARPGDIFTPQVRAMFRRLMYPELKGKHGRETKAEIKEDAPAAIALKVNASYPEGQPLPTMPPNLLETLPHLPEDLEYRVVDKHLILRDVDANIIVDYIPSAIR
jgi:hypothetical protein